MMYRKKLDFSKATKQQLHHIATDETLEIQVRFDAAAELGRRKKEEMLREIRRN